MFVYFSEIENVVNNDDKYIRCAIYACIINTAIAKTNLNVSLSTCTAGQESIPESKDCIDYNYNFDRFLTGHTADAVRLIGLLHWVYFFLFFNSESSEIEINGKFINKKHFVAS